MQLKPIFLILCAVPILLTACGGVPEKGTISGKVASKKGPISGAEVELRNYRDEPCVKLAELTKLTKQEENQLKECEGPGPRTLSNAQGQYSLNGLKTGWYKLIIKINLRSVPSGLPLSFENDYLVAYIRRTSSFGLPTFHAVVQGKISYFDETKGAIKDFTSERELDVVVYATVTGRPASQTAPLSATRSGIAPTGRPTNTVPPINRPTDTLTP